MIRLIKRNETLWVIGSSIAGDSEYLHIAKLAAKYEIPAAMQYSAEMVHPLGLHHLSSLFTLVYPEAEHQKVLENISPRLAHFTGQRMLRQPEEFRNEILVYLPGEHL